MPKAGAGRKRSYIPGGPASYQSIKSILPKAAGRQSFLSGRSGWMTSAEAENYVVINGVYSDDERLVREKAMEALENVSFDEEELRDMLASPL